MASNSVSVTTSMERSMCMQRMLLRIAKLNSHTRAGMQRWLQVQETPR